METFDTAIKAFWNARAASTDQRASRFHSSHTDYDLNAINALIPPQSRILDLGCGRGEVACALAQSGHKVTAVDFMPGFIDHIPDGLGIEKCVADAREYKSANHAFDAILMLGLITSFPNSIDRDLLYRNAHQMITPHGSVFIKAQFGITDDVLIDKWSDDLGMHYTGIYPARDREVARLGHLFDTTLVDPYPDELNKFSNTRMHYVVAKPKPDSVV